MTFCRVDEATSTTWKTLPACVPNHEALRKMKSVSWVARVVGIGEMGSHFLVQHLFGGPQELPCCAQGSVIGGWSEAGQLVHCFVHVGKRRGAVIQASL